MQYVIQRRNPLGGLEFLDETDDFIKACKTVKRINRDRGREYKAYPAYLFDTVGYRAIKLECRRGSYWCIWVGGSSYSIGDPEYFTSIQSIKDELHKRMNNQRRYPCVGDDTYFECYAGERGSYPDFVIKVGKRGGIIKESC
jgi:hypothetical protein